MQKKKMRSVKRKKKMNVHEWINQLINQGVLCMGFGGSCCFLFLLPYTLQAETLGFASGLVHQIHRLGFINHENWLLLLESQRLFM